MGKKESNPLPPTNDKPTICNGITESNISKGGHNSNPKTPRPSEPPKGQSTTISKGDIEYYEVPIHCGNCKRPNNAIGESYWVKIPKGTTIDDFLKQMKCKYCGCITLKRG